MHEIKLYGEVVPFEDAWIIEQGGFVNLTYVQQQLKEAGGKDIRVRINSCGGDVDTGFAIYAELRRYAKENNAKVITFGEARVASIATVFFLAGDQRILTEHTEPFVHNAWTYAEGDSKQITRVALELDKYNNKIAQHYANHTELTFDEALELMNNETSITTEEAKAMRFCTEIEEVLRPVALKRFTNKIESDMNKNKKTNAVIAMAKALLKTFKASAVNKLIMTADETEIDFYELEEDEPIEVGANARIDGQDAEGSFVMKDGATFVFEKGVLTEMKEETDNSDEVVEAMQEEIDTLTNQLEQVVTNSQTEIETLKAENAKHLVTINALKKVTSAKAPEKSERQKPTTTPKAENQDESINNAIKGLIKK